LPIGLGLLATCQHLSGLSDLGYSAAIIVCAALIVCAAISVCIAILDFVSLFLCFKVITALVADASTIAISGGSASGSCYVVSLVAISGGSASGSWYLFVVFHYHSTPTALTRPGCWNPHFLRILASCSCPNLFLIVVQIHHLL
jgi:hypothetical protein